MSNLKAIVTLLQTYNTKGEITYIVVATKNTTDPKIGNHLSEKDVWVLTAAGTEVEIK